MKATSAASAGLPLWRSLLVMMQTKLPTRHLTPAEANNPDHAATYTPRGLISLQTSPKQLEMTFVEAWKYLAKCCPNGVLTNRDRICLETAASLFVEFCSAPVKLNRATGAADSHAGELGMNPADASRLCVAKAPNRGDFDD